MNGLLKCEKCGHNRTSPEDCSERDDTVIDSYLAAIRLGICSGSLRNLRSQGRGPKYCRVGRRVVYRIRDVESYLDAHSVDPESDQ